MRTTLLVAITMFSLSAPAATVNVVSTRLTGFDFTLIAKPGAGHSGETSTSETLGQSTDLIAGPLDPVLSFALANVGFGVTGSESWDVQAYTTAAAPATVDTATNTLTIDLGSFVTRWQQTGVVPPRGFRGCGGGFPDCSALPQGPVGGSVTGPWDPVTGAFELAWSRDIDAHPFPRGTGLWAARGVSVVPLPAAAGLMLLALGSLGGMALRQRKPRLD